MQTYMETESHVFHMEVDFLNNNVVLFSDGCALKSTQNAISTTLVGSALNCGYDEGRSTVARFKLISGFVQLNNEIVILVDRENYCLRQLDRTNLQTSVFVGQCGASGSDDGSSAKFSDPYSILIDPRSGNKLLVIERFSDGAVRQVDVITRETTTLMSKPSGFSGPVSFALDPEDNLIITETMAIWKYNLDSENIEKVAGSSNTGSEDGPLNVANFQWPKGMVFFTRDIILLSDYLNHKMRVVNLADGEVFSLCSGEQKTRDGLPDQCGIEYPEGTLLLNDHVLVGQKESIRLLPRK